VRGRDEAGVVAIVMTLAISTFLLGVAALAVDLGQAYLRQNDLQSLADRLALAGAKGLPTIGEPEGALDQVTTMLEAVCSRNEAPEGLCPAPSAAAWTDGNPANGEITFFADADSDGQVGRADAVTSLSTPSQALRVVLPPSTVQFGLAGAIGFSSARIQKSATARIGTPLGSGLLPFALTPDDLTAGRFCVVDTDQVQIPSPVTASTISDSTRLTLNSSFPEGLPVAGTRASFSITPSGYWWPIRSTFFHLRTADGTEQSPSGERTGWNSYRATLPPGTAGSQIQVWATGRLSRSSSSTFTTNAIRLTYTGTPPVTDPPSESTCDHASAGRGLLQLGTSLETSLRSGPLATGVLGLLNPGSSGGFSDALTSGFLRSAGNRAGRLIGDTGHGTLSVNGYSVDATSLFDSSHLLDPQYAGGTGLSLQTLLDQGRAAQPGNRGWITAAAVRSHRLAVVPVVDPDLTEDENTLSVSSFRYVWIDGTSPNRGLLWRDGRLVGFEGYVVDPGYLPAVVSGSGTVGPFLGSDMPKEAVLIPDLAGSPG
jgi:Flp pilus assembly protein TadG